MKNTIFTFCVLGFFALAGSSAHAQSSGKSNSPQGTQAFNEWYTTCGAANYWDFGTITPTGVQQMVGGNNYDLCCEKMGKGAFVVGADGSHYCFELNITGSGLPYGQGCEVMILDGACGTATQNIISDIWMTTNAAGTSVTGGTANGTTGPGNQITDCGCWTASAADVGKTYYLQLSEGPGGGAFFGANGFCTVYLYYRTGDYTCSGGAIVLPVELTKFTAQQVNAKTKLEWTTASENNNKNFAVERSLDGIEFTTVAMVKGAGNSNISLNYSAYDDEPAVGLNYYRLKQTDMNGSSKYSTIISVSKDPVIGSLLPNPAANEVGFKFYSPSKALATIQVLDVTGRVVVDEQVDVSEGNQYITTQINNLESGAYYFRVSVDEIGYTYTTKLIKR